MSVTSLLFSNSHDDRLSLESTYNNSTVVLIRIPPPELARFIAMIVATITFHAHDLGEGSNI
jgi:hypothetical protein